MEYRHTQMGTVIIASVLVAVFLILAIFSATGEYPLPPLIVLILLLAALALFYSLRVVIKANTLICRFGVGIIQKRIPLSEIQQVRIVKNPWWAGWGIRWMPGQYTLWNVSGFLAVELTLQNGKNFRIGTDEPELLAQAIGTYRTIGNGLVGGGLRESDPRRYR